MGQHLGMTKSCNIFVYGNATCHETQNHSTDPTVDWKRLCKAECKSHWEENRVSKIEWGKRKILNAEWVSVSQSLFCLSLISPSLFLPKERPPNSNFVPLHSLVLPCGEIKLCDADAVLEKKAGVGQLLVGWIGNLQFWPICLRCLDPCLMPSTSARTILFSFLPHISNGILDNLGVCTWF